MSFRDKLCITVSGTTNEEIWKEIRSSVGGTQVNTPNASGIMNSEIAEYDTWVASNGPVPFDKWFLWYFTVGTVRYGNLSKNKVHDGKVGHIYSPCPYSTQSNDVRTRHMLKLAVDEVMPTKTNHEEAGITYYMETAANGNRWGFRCTHIGCPYYILTGSKYFYA